MNVLLRLLTIVFRVARCLADTMPGEEGFHSVFLPKKVFGEEVVARAIFCSIHISSNGKKLKPAAFQPTRETDEISIMRTSFLGCHLCKRKARELERPKDNKVYRGFAVMYVRGIRDAGCQVVDSRKEFLGHADIRTGVVTPPRGIPLEPEMREKSKRISESLVALSKYISDPSPLASKWRGPVLTPQR